MKKTLILVAALVLLVPAATFADQVQFRLGFFMPGAVKSSNVNILTHPDSLFAIEFSQMSFLPKDYNSAVVGFGYDYFVNKHISLGVSVDAYNKSQVGYYLDWVMNTLTDGDFAFPYELYYGSDITHSLRLGLTPVQVSLKLTPFGRRARVVPYVGGGGSLVFWTVSMFGDQVDLGTDYTYPDPDIGDVTIHPVISVNARESGASLGWHAFGGFQVPIGYRATIDAEARYQGGAKGDLHKLFVGFEPLDLSSWSFTLGVSYWF